MKVRNILTMVMLSVAQVHAVLVITYTGTFELNDWTGDGDLLGLDGATFYWKGTFDENATPYYTNGSNLDGFIGDISLTLSGTVGNDGTYSPSYLSQIDELYSAVNDEYWFNTGDFDFGGVRLSVGQLAVATGFTGAVSPTNTLTPVNTSDVIDFRWWEAFRFSDGASSHYTISNPQITSSLVTEVINTNDSGAGSLRQAIIDGGDTITFTNTLAGQTIVLTSGQILIDKDLDIDASGIGGITIDGNANGRIFEIAANNTAVFDFLVLTNGLPAGGYPDNSGGAILINSGASLTLENSTLSGNAALFGGGVLISSGSLTLNNSTLSGNFASQDGGGINMQNGSELSLFNTTIANNEAVFAGGGIVLNSGILTLGNSTLSGNLAGDVGGGIINSSGTLMLTNSIVSVNTASSGANISGLFSGSNNLINGIPLLAPLGNYGGPTQTMPPLPGSPAIDAGASTTFSNDQRGFARVVNGTIDIGAVESGNAVPSVDYTQVSSTDDFLNGLTNSGVSLRDAVAFAPTGSTLTFDPSLANSTIVLSLGQILLDKNLQIDASGIEGITIDGNGGVTSNRIFEIAANTTNVFDSLILTNGFAAGISFPVDSGGAIYIKGPADLTLNNTILTGNSADNTGGGISCDVGVTLTLNDTTFEGNSARVGGGIYNNGFLLKIDNSTFAGNSATDIGGGILHLNNQLMINNSTFSGNSTSGSGGGIGNSNGDIELYNTTLAANSATNTGGGIWNVGGSYTLTLTNTIVAGNTAPSDTEISGSFSGSNNLTSGDPMLNPLGDYGGPTQTMPPRLGSPAIDAGLNSATNSPADQRGFTRVFNGTVDIGAVEILTLLVVQNNADTGSGSLREATMAVGSGGTITFTNTLSGQTIVLTSGQILLENSLGIDASGIGGITIDGNGTVTSNRIFEIAANTTNVFDSLTLTNGFAAGISFPVDSGGAIYINGPAELTLNTTTLAGNTANNLGGGISVDFGVTMTLNNSTFEGNSSRVGGGIYNNGLLLKIDNSTFAGNSATDIGGGILHLNNQLMINNSTFSGNSTSGSGGGIGNSNGSIELYNSTLAGNSAANTGGGIWNVGGSYTLTLTNSIVAGNTASSDTDISGPFSGSNNLTSGDPLLWPLGGYGGPTQTMPPLPGSPAIDAGLTSATNSLTDQRGMTRVLAYGSGVPVVDIGAVEYNGWLVGADLSGIDPALFLPGSIYDGTTLFPGGFDPSAAGMLEILSQSDLIAQGEANVTNNPVAYGLYTESAFQVLALDRPFLTYNVASNTFTLTVGILQTPDLVSTPFTNLTGFTTIPYPGDGEIDIEFAPPNSDARFFEVYGSEPPSP